MKHRINDCLVNLRELTEDELARLVASTIQRQDRVQEELESLVGEVIRRTDNVHQLKFDLPPLHSYDGTGA